MSHLFASRCGDRALLRNLRAPAKQIVLGERRAWLERLPTRGR